MVKAGTETAMILSIILLLEQMYKPLKNYILMIKLYNFKIFKLVCLLFMKIQIKISLKIKHKISIKIVN
jgi:hypothetical protein